MTALCVRIRCRPPTPRVALPTTYFMARHPRTQPLCPRPVSRGCNGTHFCGMRKSTQNSRRPEGTLRSLCSTSPASEASIAFLRSLVATALHHAPAASRMGCGASRASAYAEVTELPPKRQAADPDELPLAGSSLAVSSRSPSAIPKEQAEQAAQAEQVAPPATAAAESDDMSPPLVEVVPKKKKKEDPSGKRRRSGSMPRVEGLEAYASPDMAGMAQGSGSAEAGVPRIAQRRQGSVGVEAVVEVSSAAQDVAVAEEGLANQEMAPGSGFVDNSSRQVKRISQRRQGSVGEEAMMEAMTAAEDHAADMEAEASATNLAAGSGFRDASEPRHVKRISQRRQGSIGEEAMMEAMTAADDHAAEQALDAPPPAADAP